MFKEIKIERGREGKGNIPKDFVASLLFQCTNPYL
jgi:hypothetical protein